MVDWRQKLGADPHREQPGGAEVDEHAAQVLHPDYLVVKREPEVPGQAGAVTVAFLRVNEPLAARQAAQVGEDAKADQPPEHKAEVADHARGLVPSARPDLLLAATDHIAAPVP